MPETTDPTPLPGEPPETPQTDGPGPLARRGLSGPRTRSSLLIGSLVTATLLSIGLGVAIPALVRGRAAIAPAPAGLIVPGGATNTTSSMVHLDGDSPAGVAATPPTPPPGAVPPARSPAPPTPNVHAAPHRAGAGPIQAPPAAPPPCASSDLRLTLTIHQPAPPGTVIVDAHLANLAGHPCLSPGDDWRIDVTDTSTPPLGLMGEGGGAATSTGLVIAAGVGEDQHWSWNEQDCHIACTTVAPGPYRATVEWNGVSAAVPFTLPL